MNICRGLLVLVLILPFLQGCAGAVIAAQMFPAVIGVGSVAGSGDRSPFRIDIPDAAKRADKELVELDTRIHQAACGDPQSQFWLASALQNNFNEQPNHIEIYKWYRLAEAGKFAPASARLAAMNDLMSASEIAQAVARAEVWQPLSEGCSSGS